MAIQSLPATESRLEAVRAHQGEDWIFKQVAVYCQDGWPTKSNVHASLKPFLFGSRRTLSTRWPTNERESCSGLRAELLAQLHAGHQGISKSRQRARQSMWWPGMSADLEKMVRSCSEAAQNVQSTNPLDLSPSCQLQCPLYHGNESEQIYSNGKEQIIFSSLITSLDGLGWSKPLQAV